MSRWQRAYRIENTALAPDEIAHTRVRMEGWRQRQLGCAEEMEVPKTALFILDGLPMEGLRPKLPMVLTNVRIGRLTA